MKLGQKVLGKALFGMIMKQTFYGHFVAGEDQERIKPTISRMQSFGVKSILDYSVEVDESEKKEDKKSFKKVRKIKVVGFYLYNGSVLLPYTLRARACRFPTCTQSMGYRL